MIDKLKLSTTLKTDNSYISSLVTGHKLVVVRDNNYKYMYVDKSVGFSLGIDNRYNGNNMVSLNPSRHGDYIEMLNYLSDYFLEFYPELFRLRRIDFAVDIPEQLQDIFRSSFVKNYRKACLYTNAGKLETIYHGKYPKITVFYHDKRKYSDNESRIERRYFSYKIPEKIEYLDGLPNVIEIHPFNDMEQIVVIETEPSTPAERLKYYGIKYMIQEFGYSETRKKLNQNGNFNKRYAYLFDKTVRNYNLQDIFIDNIETFFNKGGERLDE